MSIGRNRAPPMSFRLGIVPSAILLWIVRAVTPNKHAISRQVYVGWRVRPRLRSIVSKRGYRGWVGLTGTSAPSGCGDIVLPCVVILSNTDAAA
jgi:hypothetical protein